MSDEKIPEWMQAIVDKHMRAMLIEIAIEHVNRTVLQPLLQRIELGQPDPPPAGTKVN